MDSKGGDVSIFDIFKPKTFKAGPLSHPTKFVLLCRNCNNPHGFITMRIPSGMEEPSVEIKCQCGTAEVVGVR